MKAVSLLLILIILSLSGCTPPGNDISDTAYDMEKLGYNFIIPKVSTNSVNLLIVDFERGLTPDTVAYDDKFKGYEYVLFIDGNEVERSDHVGFTIDRSILTSKPTDVRIEVYNRYGDLDFSIQWDDYMIFDENMTAEDILKYKDEIQSIMLYNNPEDMTVLSELLNLKYLTFWNCDIQDTSAVPTLPELRKLNFVECDNFTDISNLEKLPKLEVLVVELCANFENVEPVRRIEHLKHVYFVGCMGVTEIGSLKEMPNLEYINIMSTYNVSDSNSFRDEIWIDSGNRITGNNNFMGNQYLLHYHTGGNSMLLTLDDFDLGIFHDKESAGHEFELYIDGELIERKTENTFMLNISDFTDRPHDILVVAKDENKVTTHGISCQNVMIYNEDKNKMAVDRYKDAEVLFLYGTVTDMSIFSKMPNLVAFEMTDGHIDDITGISEMPRLRRVYFEYVSGLRDISPLTDLRELEITAFLECTHLEDVTPLARMDTLRYIFLPNCHAVNDVSDLASLPNLVYIYPPHHVDVSAFEDRQDVKVANYLIRKP